MKIIGLTGKNSGPGYHRIVLPLMNMDADVFITNQLDEKIIEEKGCDILFYNRLVNDQMYDKIQAWRKIYGFKVIVDYDDYWFLDSGHILYSDYIREGIPNKMLKTIEEADMVTCTHERLKLAISMINSNVKIFPNAIPKNDQFDIKTEPGNKVRLFWAGSNTHQKDIEILRNPLKRVDVHLRDKILMVMGGYNEKFPAWKEMVSAYTNGGELPSCLLEGREVFDYYGLYYFADVALIPLKETLFNGYKSNLKILEAANMGIPVIVSKVQPYLDFPEDIVCYVEKQSDWYKWIKRLVNDEQERKERGHFLKAYCDEVYNFGKINLERQKTFAQLVENNIYGYEPIITG